MAFRPLSLSSHVTFVSHLDPAVDWSLIVDQVVAETPELQRPELEAKVRDAAARDIFTSRFMKAVFVDPGVSQKMLVFRAGETPTFFDIGVIPGDEIVRINDDPNRTSRQWRAFLAGLRNVRGFPGDPPKMRKVGDVEYVDPSWSKPRFGVRGLMEVSIDVGAITFAWNQLREDDAKN